jgi:hypothetical protein
MNDRNGNTITTGAECRFKFGHSRVQWLKAKVVAVNNEGTQFASVTIEAEPTYALGTSLIREEWPRNVVVIGISY